MRMQHGARELDGRCVALRRIARDDRSARISEPQRFCHLVERLAHGIVYRRAQRDVVAPSAHMHEHGVAARHERNDSRRFEIRCADLVGIQMPLEMVHADEGNIQRPSSTLRKRDSHDERAHETRCVRDGNGIQIAPTQTAAARTDGSRTIIQPSCNQGFLAHAADSLDVLAARNLGNDAPKTRMEIDLRCHDIRKKIARTVDDCGSRLVT